jgi:hypothetical protein
MSPRGVDAQVEPAVAADLVEHVVEERQPGGGLHGAGGTVDVEADADRRLLGGPLRVAARTGPVDEGEVVM